jgi:outer membrane protein TolC
VLWQRWLSIVLAVFLAGCVRYEPQPLHPQQIESAFRARTLADAGLRQFVETNFTSPPVVWPPAAFDLKSLTLAALYFHPDLQLARARVATARAAEITAGARPNPTAGLMPTWVFNSFPGETPWLFGASFDVPIETAGKRRHRIELARALTADARLGFSETAWNVRARLRQALVEYFCAQRALELFQAEAQTQTQLTNILQQRMQAGESSRFELTVARTQSLNATLAVLAAQTRLADARQAVASALGLPAAALERTTLAWPQFDEPPANISTGALQSAALLGRVDVARALAQYAAAEAALRLETARQYPDIHLDPGYEFDQGEHKFFLGPSISLPIFDRNQGPMAEAVAKREAAAANFLAVQTAAIQEMEKATTDYQAVLAEWAEADETSRRLQRELAGAAEQQVRAGEADRLSVIYAQLQRDAAERARLETLRKVQDALGGLEEAARRPLFDAEDWSALERLENYHPPKQTP